MSQSLNRLNTSDSTLITSKDFKDVFGSSKDVAEFHIFDLNNNLLTSDYNYLDYKPQGVGTTVQSLEVDPTTDCLKRNFEQGSFKLYYNFFRNITTGNFFVKVISTDRKEVALSSNNLSNVDIENVYNTLKDNFETYNYLQNYIINFNQNITSLIVNVALDTTNDVYEIYIKLYEPLQKTIVEKTVCKIQQEVIPTNYVELDLVKNIVSETNLIKLEPNFDINVDDKIGNTTDYLDIQTLSSDITYSNPLTSLLANKSLKININFEDFSDFINYSSAESRVNNFFSKVTLIETYNANITNGIGQIDYNKSKIKDIVTNFDLYEYYLYTNSYPKDSGGNLRPSVSIFVTEWLEALLEKAVDYDNFNSNKLLDNIPAYLLVDTRNEPLYHFINMMGHTFDNIWVYIKKMSDIYVANNNMMKGISPTLVEDVLKSFGVKLYNSLSNVQLSNTEKYEYNSEIYKRLYHNLPQLFKNKGTLNGLRQLINIFGIPETIFKIYEYGSLDKTVNNLEHSESIFNYALDINRIESVTIPFKEANTNDTIKSFTFRMKLKSKPLQSTRVIGDFDPRDFNPNDFYYITTQGDFDGHDFNDSDFKTDIIVVDKSERLLTMLTGTNSFLTVELENFDDEVCRLYIQHNGVSSLQIEVDIYNNKFNTFYLQREYQPLENKTKYALKVVKDGIVKETYLYITNEQTTIYPNKYDIKLFDTLDCNVQSLELRNDYLTNDQLISRYYNPSSFEGVYDNIVTYLPLGTNLYTYNHSIVTSQHNIVFNNFPNKINYVTNYEQICYNSFGTPTTRRITDKIKIKTNDTHGTLLSSFNSILENNEKEFENHKFLDVVFSPNFEQDDDIIDMFGNIKIDDYIGSPDGLYDTSYPNLLTLKREYLKRTLGQYNIKDYFNLIQHIDNSLFKMIYDFVPFSKNTSSGILVKSNILHRNKVGSLKPSSFSVDAFEMNFSNGNVEVKYCEQNEIGIEVGKIVSPNNVNPYLKPILSKLEKDSFKYSPYCQDNVFDKSVFYGETRVGTLTGTKINEYTKGDKTLGKTPVLTHYVDKIGLFTSIVSNKIFDKKCNIELKYLVDKDGNLTDLNHSNKNFYDIQSYFVKGDKCNVSLFDVNKYSNQKTLNGLKPIFSSGFSYSPSFYFSPKDRYLKFDNISEDSSFLRYIEPSDRDISNKKFVYDLFPKVDLDTTGTFTVGSETNKKFSSYQIQESKQYQFNLDLDLLVKPTSSDFSFKYKLSTYKNYINDDSIIDSVTYTYNPQSPEYDVDGNEIPISKFGSTRRNLEIPVEGQESMEIFNMYWSNSTNSLDSKSKPIYKQGRVWKWDNIVRNDFNDTSGLTPNYRIYTSDDEDKYKSGKVYEVKNSITKVVEKLYDEYYQYDSETINISIPVYEAQFWFLGNILIGNRGIITKGVSATSRKSNSFSKYDKIYFVLEQIDSNKVEPNSITLMKSSSIYTTTNNSSYDLGTTDEIIKTLKPNLITINKRLYDYLGATTFNGSNSTLYEKYGDVDEIFSIRSGDFIYIKDGKTKNYYYLEINEVILNDNDLTITLFNTIPSFVVKENVEECVFIKRIKDETSIVIDFKKKDGDTSYGFVIPSNINPTFLNNIDTITKQVNLKLLKTDIYK